MSKIDELIVKLCPDGVEYKAVSDVIESLKTGLNPRQNFKLNEDGATCFYITGKDVFANKINISDRTDRISEETVHLINKRACLHDDILLFVSTGTGTVGRMTVVSEYSGDWNVSETMYVIAVKRDQVMTKYLSYYLYSAEAKSQFEPKISKGSVPHLKVTDLLQVRVPVPPLEVQREIVHVLDNFTFLSAELSAELQARKKQYEYYRDLLLDAPKWDTEEVLLSDIASYSKERISASEVSEDTYVGVDNLLQFKQGKTKSEHVPTEGNLTRYRPNDILIGNIRPYLRKIWFADNEGGTNGDVLVIRTTSDRVLPQYLYCNLSSERFFEYDDGKSKGAKMPRGDKDSIMNYLVKIPSLDIQRKVVRTLDNFDCICNDLSIGLPAEIEARQRQYEYYRDALLTFAETGKIISTDRQTDRQGIIRLIQYVFGFANVQLRDIATVIRGGHFQKKDFVEEGYPCIHYGQMYTHFGIYANDVIKYISADEYKKSKHAVKNDIVMAVTSENVEDVCSCTAWLGEDDIAVSGHTAIIHHDQNAKYLSYYFHTDHFFLQKKKLAHGTKVIEITPDRLLDIEIPLPSIDKQNEITAVLDKFDSICNDLSNGLPAEIEARQKQYEYYRDMLLSFREATEN